MTILDKPIVQFLIGGIILSGGTYLADYSHPVIAILLVSFPLELITLYLIKKERKKKEFLDAWIAALIATLCAAAFLYFILPFTPPPAILHYNFKLLYTFLVICILTIVSFFLVNDAKR